MIDKQRSSFIRRIVASQPSIWLSFIYSQAIIWIISGNFQTQIRTLQDGLTLLKMARSKFSKSSTSSSFSEGESHCACSTLLPAVSPMWWVGGYLFERIHFPSVETRHRGCGSKIQVFPRFGHLFTDSGCTYYQHGLSCFLCSLLKVVQMPSWPDAHLF